MKAFIFVVFCCAGIVAASASGVAIVPATAHGGVIAGHGGIVGPFGLGAAGILGPAGLAGVGPLGLLGHELVGSGIEGQYVPSGNELLYDDGSYRPEHHFAGDHGIYGLHGILH